jgi:ribulose-5-phosphate 4-epimerase/fuculose-1-phosphate aldolase
MAEARGATPATPTATEAELVEQVAWACRILAGEGYSDLTLGHVSARSAAEPGRIWIKRRGVNLSEVTPDDVIPFDIDGQAAADRTDMHLEAVLHIEVYKRRPEVGAIVHGHPPYATAFAATEATLETLTHDAVMFADGLSFYDGTPELITEPDQGRAVAEALADRSVVVLRNHGVLVAHKDVPWVVLASVTLERAVRLQAIASTLGELRPIPSDLVQTIHELKYQDGLVAEYWESWIRDLRRHGADHGMRE